MIDLVKPLWQMTCGEFIEVIESMKPKIVPEEKFFSPVETAKFLGCSQSCLYRWRKLKVLEASKQGGLLKYKLSDLNNFQNHKTTI